MVLDALHRRHFPVANQTLHDWKYEWQCYNHYSKFYANIYWQITSGFSYTPTKNVFFCRVPWGVKFSTYNNQISIVFVEAHGAIHLRRTSIVAFISADLRLFAFVFFRPRGWWKKASKSLMLWDPDGTSFLTPKFKLYVVILSNRNYQKIIPLTFLYART